MGYDFFGTSDYNIPITKDAIEKLAFRQIKALSIATIRRGIA